MRIWGRGRRCAPVTDGRAAPPAHRGPTGGVRLAGRRPPWWTTTRSTSWPSRRWLQGSALIWRRHATLSRCSSSGSRSMICCSSSTTWSTWLAPVPSSVASWPALQAAACAGNHLLAATAGALLEAADRTDERQDRPGRTRERWTVGVSGEHGSKSDRQNADGGHKVSPHSTLLLEVGAALPGGGGIIHGRL